MAVSLSPTLKAVENENVAWAKCVKSIDEMGRRLNCPPRYTKKSQNKSMN